MISISSGCVVSRVVAVSSSQVVKRRPIQHHHHHTNITGETNHCARHVRTPPVLCWTRYMDKHARSVRVHPIRAYRRKAIYRVEIRLHTRGVDSLADLYVRTRSTASSQTAGTAIRVRTNAHEVILQMTESAWCSFRRARFYSVFSISFNKFTVIYCPSFICVLICVCFHLWQYSL